MKLVMDWRRGGDSVTLQPAVQRLVEVEDWASVPYERSLAAPNCDAEAEIGRAVRSFLSCHQVDCPVAVTSHGQNLVVRLIKFPPVEPEKLADIVRYEAHHQIPFDLKDVVWRWLDLDKLSGRGEVDRGYRAECEVALFAQKRDLIETELRRLKGHGLKVKLMQAQPLTLTNYLWSCHFGVSRGGAGGHVLVLDMGARATTLVITDGHSFWVREIPVGGANFTKEIARRRQLTFGAAEELKCAANPPATLPEDVAVTMSDLETEVERSLLYFRTLNREVSLTGVACFGNGFRLQGVKERLSQKLGLPALELEPGNFLDGAAVLDAEFRRNAPALVPAADAALEQLGIGKFFVNLLENGKLPKRTIGSAWGLDIGAHALKAVRLRRREV